MKLEKKIFFFFPDPRWFNVNQLSGTIPTQLGNLITLQRM